ncbi:NUDIX hydrolase [Acetomicrobium sp. S15 = DSM 107314]|uniref:NUDIX hydrolase n=1 Tax=Acetomicrobium sp. S15 = DSM 107314 TaxID=2529858 RepID=UPI0018E10343|nr:CoA pyrophosphatase [Acetomicrobium sp. S15 = DSM 107314]
MTQEVDGLCHRDQLSIEKLRSAFPPLERVPSWDEFIFGGDSGFKWSAVLVPFISHSDGARVILVKRPDNLRVHGGEISFPGGGVEDEDLSPVDTALREAEEELGLPRHCVVPLSLMPVEHTYASSYAVYPVLGWIEGVKEFRPSPEEVVEVIFLDLDRLDIEPKIERAIRNGVEISYPVYDLPKGMRIWGVTARILWRITKRLREDGYR